MNLSAPFICEFFKDAQEKALPYVDYVFGNETEARTFSKVHGWEVRKKRLVKRWYEYDIDKLLYIKIGYDVLQTDNVEEIAIG